MLHVPFLIVGAGMSGLAAAAFLGSDDYLILEALDSIGGWCKTVRRSGFVWDYSGHFFHFREPEIEAYLRARMDPDEVETVERDSRVYYAGELIDFPFQKNIHQLPKEEFIECLHDLILREPGEGPAPSFEAMLRAKFGRAIAEKFLIPYNEKLYACDLDKLDAEAMGRFFPHADVRAIVRNMRAADNTSYNATFTYPRGGAIRYVEALASEVDPDKIALREALTEVDLARKVARTSAGRAIRFEHLISSAPFDRFAALCGLPSPPETFTYNKVLVFNLGFDRKGPEHVHWIYYPQRELRFYRVGFYDNIMGDDRMSLYVEIGMDPSEPVDEAKELERVLIDLERCGVRAADQKLVAHHSVILDPAYVHITTRSRQRHAELAHLMRARGVHPIGRYGGWTYCSIEDNILEARALAGELNVVHRLDDPASTRGAE